MQSMNGFIPMKWYWMLQWRKKKKFSINCFLIEVMQYCFLRSVCMNSSFGTVMWEECFKLRWWIFCKRQTARLLWIIFWHSDDHNYWKIFFFDRKCSLKRQEDWVIHQSPIHYLRIIWVNKPLMIVSPTITKVIFSRRWTRRRRGRRWCWLDLTFCPFHPPKTPELVIIFWSYVIN